MVAKADEGNSDLLFKIKALMTMRAIFVSVLLIIIVLFQARFSSHPVISPVTALIALTYLLTIFYALFLPAFKNLVGFAYFQICTDLFIETGIIFYTGGGYSPFTFMYLLTIISASIILFKTGGFWIASLASLLYALLSNLELFGYIHPLYIYPVSLDESRGFVHYNLALNISAFFTVAYLSGFLAENVRRAGNELAVKQEDFINLKTYHEVVVENMGSGLIAADTGGRILSANKAVNRITGYSFNELSGRNLFSFFNISPKKNRQTIQQNTPERYELFFRRKTGKKVFLGITQSHLQSNRNFSGYIFVFQDLTEMKTMERRVAGSERQAAIGRVAAGIAHEIRNPLGSLSGSIQVLKNRLKLDKTDKKLMDIIIRETDRLNGIIVDFLQYATPQATEKKKCNLIDLVNETVLLLKNHPDISKGILVEWNEREITKFFIFADPGQIRQVLWNLCLNGIQAMESSGILKIAPKTGRSKTGETGVIEIIDHGVGIQARDLRKVYEPFFTTKPNGTGLGLSTVYRIVEDNSGTITLVSTPGQGTT
ncbi:MAG: nitrogen regulation protein NR(II), partial [Nitrospinota bacterium]